MIRGQPEHTDPKKFVCNNYESDPEYNTCESHKNKGIQRKDRSIYNPSKNDPTNICNPCIWYFRGVLK